MTASAATRVVRLRSVLLTSPSACLALSLAWGMIALARSRGLASMAGILGSDVGGGSGGLVMAVVGGAGICVAVGSGVAVDSGVGISVGF